MIIANRPVTFPLEDVNNQSILELLRDRFTAPNGLIQCRQFANDFGASGLKQLWWKTIRS